MLFEPSVAGNKGPSNQETLEKGRDDSPFFGIDSEAPGREGPTAGSLEAIAGIALAAAQQEH